MLLNARMDSISVLSEAIATFKLKDKYINRPRPWRWTSCVSWAPHYILLSYPLLICTCLMLPLVSTGNVLTLNDTICTCQSINTTQSGPQMQRSERHVPRRGASSWSPSKTSIKSRVHVVLLSSPKWSKERVMWLTVGKGEETSKVLANKTSRERDSTSDHLLCGFSSREASPLVPLKSDRINVFWKCLYGLKCW